MSNTTKTKTTISQHKLRRFEDLQAQVALLAPELDALKKEIMSSLLEGTRCQAGPLSALVDETATTSTKWKEEFIAVAGKPAADAVSARDKGNSVRRKLIVKRAN